MGINHRLVHGYGVMLRKKWLSNINVNVLWYLYTVHCESVTLELSVSYNYCQCITIIVIIDWLAGIFFLLITLWVLSVHKLKSISTRSGCTISIFSLYTGGLDTSICLSSSTSKLTRVATRIYIISFIKRVINIIMWALWKPGMPEYHGIWRNITEYVVSRSHGIWRNMIG
jgi:hypothetical protein